MQTQAPVRLFSGRRTAYLCFLVVGLALGLTNGCSRGAPEATPEGVVRELLDRFDRAESDPTEIQGAVELLSLSTQANLAERARRASAATGRNVLPHEMIAPARFAPRFQPRQMHTHAMGDHALVDVVGIDPDTDRAEVTCVLEDGKWRIEMALPPVPPAEHRSERSP